MKIHHLRNATCVLETENKHILIDPMLNKKGDLPPFSAIRFKARCNPLVDLPPNSQSILEQVTHCFITHSSTFGIKALQHTDHLDLPGETFLIQHDIPVVTGEADANYLKKYGLRVEKGLRFWKPQTFGSGTVMAVPARHGHGWNSHLMANGIGFFLELQNEPSVYIGGDTVFTKDVERLFDEYKPDITILAAGSAQLDIGPPILMDPVELLECIKKAPGKVLLNHLEALNHCPTTRKFLNELVKKHNLQIKVLIPEDGETVAL